MTRLGRSVLAPTDNILWLCPRRWPAVLLQVLPSNFWLVLPTRRPLGRDGRHRGRKVSGYAWLSPCKVSEGQGSSQGLVLSVTPCMWQCPSGCTTSAHDSCGPPTPAHIRGVTSTLVGELSSDYRHSNAAGTLTHWKSPPRCHHAHGYFANY